jgi:Tfp pilus assembly protein PilN
MTQKINLLFDLPKWEKAQYPFNFVIGLNVVLIILLIAFYSLYYFEYQTKNRIVNGMLYQYNAATQQLSSLQKQVLATGKKEKENTDYQTFLYNQLEGNAASGSQNYYNVLEALGAKINAGVWLNRIDIENFASELTLTGYTIQPQNAMAYVASLNSTPLFNTKPLKLENIRNVSSKNSLFIRIASAKEDNTKSGAK